MIGDLLQLDRQLFIKINQSSSPLADAVFPILTDLGQFPWLVRYFLPSVLLIWIYRTRFHAVFTILSMALSIGLADASSHHLIKKTVQRSRPYQTIEGAVLRTHPHAGYSFPSNHAANNFAAAYVIASRLPHLRVPAYAIAGLVSYSRIYVGVHYPLDVFCGALWGLLCAALGMTIGRRLEWWVYRIFPSKKNWPSPPKYLS